MRRRNTKITYLFGEFSKQTGLPTKAKWYRKKHRHSKDFINLDNAPTYGGYRIDVVHKGTGESFWSGSGTRRSPKEMEAYLEGLVHGSRIMKRPKKKRIEGVW